MTNFSSVSTKTPFRRNKRHNLPRANSRPSINNALPKKAFKMYLRLINGEFTQRSCFGPVLIEVGRVAQ